MTQLEMMKLKHHLFQLRLNHKIMKLQLIQLIGTQPDEEMESTTVIMEQRKETEDTETMSKEEQSTSNTLVPNDHSLENTLEVRSLNSSPRNIIDDSIGYRLPFRHNCGKLSKRYSPDHGERKSKYPIADHISTHRLSQPLKAFVHKLSSDHVSNIVQEPLNNPKWTQAIIEEMTTLQKNDMWMLVPLPKEKKTVGCRWVFSIKHKTDGSIERYKVRLVAKGYTQTYGIDYQETFSLVAQLNTVRVLSSLPVNLD